jgi:hypothetical protein
MQENPTLRVLYFSDTSDNSISIMSNTLPNFRELTLQIDMKIMDRKWWIWGLLWAIFMFVFQDILAPLADDEMLTAQNLLSGLLFWTIGGILLGWIMDKVIKPKEEKE